MNALVGYTGFVGSNICKKGKFEAVYNSKNIRQAYGTKPSLLVYAGVRAEKYLASQLPENDMRLIEQAERNIIQINPKKLILISTIDVFKYPKGVDENTVIDTNGLHAYGYNRYQFELWVREHFQDALIVRLPGLFGENIKKNFIYDYIHEIPYMLKVSKLEELAVRDPQIRKYYQLYVNGYYKVNVSDYEKESLKERFQNLGFSAINFTDSRSVYQFYNLANLWSDIETVLGAGITLWHSATEPVSAGEIYQYLTGKSFVNELEGNVADYNCRTIHADIFRGSNGYISSKEQVLKDIKIFVERKKIG